MRHACTPEPRRGMLERPAPTTFSSLPARGFYPRNPREIFCPFRSVSISISLHLWPHHPSSLLLPETFAQAWPHSCGSSSGTRRDTQGKAPRSTPPTIGLLSCYFLLVRRTTPASSRRWSWGPCMARSQQEKALFPVMSRAKELSCSPRWLLSLFWLSSSSRDDRRPFFGVPSFPASSFCTSRLFPSYRKQ